MAPTGPLRQNQELLEAKSFVIVIEKTDGQSLDPRVSPTQKIMLEKSTRKN